MTKYIVSYGVNNSHMTEGKSFSLYRDAKSFFERLDEKFKAAIVYKMSYDKYGFANGQEPKLYKFEGGKDNTELLLKLIINPPI